uniref:hypothetical protein n=1 Tax=uncultured Draconibacterium sp. TaxID=1573823 RepID=UPI003216CE16
MKKTKTITLLVLLCLVSQSVLAMRGYYKADTVRYKFDKMLIEVTSTNALRKDIMDKYQKERIRDVQKVLSGISILPPANNEQVIISFSEMGENLQAWNYKEVEMSYAAKNSKSLVIFEDGKTFEKDFGNYCIHFSFKAVETKIFVNDLADLNMIFDDVFQQKMNEATRFLSDKYGEKENKPIRGWLDLRGAEIVGYFQNVPFGSKDSIILSAGVGSGWIKNTFISDMTISLGVALGKKGMLKNYYSVDWSMMYDFSNSDENNPFELNHFLSFSYQRNFSNSPEKDSWYGFSIGYLVGRNNDFFKKNTFRLASKKRINNTFTISPELYFDDKFEDISPGIRLLVEF